MRSALPRRAAVACVGLVALACTSTHTPELAHTVVAEQSLRVRHGDVGHSAMWGRFLDGIRVEALGDDRLVAVELVVWDDVDGDGLHSPSEAAITPSTFEVVGSSTRFVEWHGASLPPGDHLRASLKARFDRGEPVELTWALFSDESATD